MSHTKNRHQAERWLQTTKEDLQAARVLSDAGMCAQACFYAQQSGEKALKSLWHLADADPSQGTRNKFRLRRASEYAEYELRLEPWCVFYRIREGVVEVVLIGEKRGNKLLIGGEEFLL